MLSPVYPPALEADNRSGGNLKESRACQQDVDASAKSVEFRNLPNCDFLPRRVHGVHRAGKKFGQGGGPIQLAFLDEHRDQRRRHGLGAGTKQKLIIERDAFCGPSLSNPCGTLGDDAPAPQNRSGYAETFASPAEYRLQEGINIGRGVVHLG